MGFDGKARKPPGPPLKSEGKRLEDGDARDKGVIVRGFGSLPTRGGMLDPTKRKLKKEKEDADRTECFAKDGSGRPASPEEIREYKEARDRVRGRASSPTARGRQSGSLSPDARSASPSAREGSTSPARPRPMTAKQFRNSMW